MIVEWDMGVLKTIPTTDKIFLKIAPPNMEQAKLVLGGFLC